MGGEELARQGRAYAKVLRWEGTLGTKDWSDEDERWWWVWGTLGELGLERLVPPAEGTAPHR